MKSVRNPHENYELYFNWSKVPDISLIFRLATWQRNEQQTKRAFIEN